MSAKHKHDNTKYYVGFGAIIAFIVLSFSYLISKDSNRIEVDKITGCPDTSNGALIVLVDRSEDYSEQGLRELQSRVLNEIKKLNAYDRVSIFTVSEVSKKNLKPIFDKCVPDLNPDPVIANKNQVNTEFKRDFIGSLSSSNDDGNQYKKGTVLHALNKKYNNSDESPIAQVITDLTLDTNRFSDIDKKRFLIFSDMLENTDRFSIYQGCKSQGDVIARFKDSSPSVNSRPKFNGAEIVVNKIPSNAPKNTLECSDFLWNWFFSGGDAKSKIELPMPGSK